MKFNMPSISVMLLVGINLVISLDDMSEDYLRRMATKDVDYIDSLARYEMTRLLSLLEKQNARETKSSIEYLQNYIMDLVRVIKVDLIGIARVDGLASSQLKRLKKLSKTVQIAIQRLQNPEKCDHNNARFLILNQPEKECNFACQLRYSAFCLHQALIHNRTLLINRGHFSIANHVFRPLSDVCTEEDLTILKQGKNLSESAVVMCDFLGQKQKPSVPDAIIKQLSDAHGQPFAWFTGQLLHHILQLRYSKIRGKVLNMFGQIFQTEEDLDEEFGLGGVPRPSHNPIVGIYIGPQDKQIDLNAYIDRIDKYFKLRDGELQMSNRELEWLDDIRRLAISKIKGRVYAVVDQPGVYETLAKKLPDYQMIPGIANSPDETSFLINLLALSRTDYLVCRLTTDMCRLAYELMQTRHKHLGDASDMVSSIDWVYHNDAYSPFSMELVMDDTEHGLYPGDEITLDPRDSGEGLVTRSINLSIPAYKVTRKHLATYMKAFYP